MSIFAVPRRSGRPPKALAGYSQTRESLVRAGVIALTEKGSSATGIEEILQSVGLPKGSFYHCFESKEVFGAELISVYYLSQAQACGTVKVAGTRCKTRKRRHDGN